MHPEVPGELPAHTEDGLAQTQPLGADVRINADPDPDPDLDVTPMREPGIGQPAEDPDPPLPE